jgi:outer membrane lipoprotein SlyB
MQAKKISYAMALVSLVMLAACGTTGSDRPGYGTSATTGGAQYGDRACANCGVVARIETVNNSSGGSTVLGTVGGAVVGGLLGHQVGSGRGNTAATVAGAAGGALAGHELQKRHNQAAGGNVSYRITVHMDNGTDEIVTQATDPDLRAGDPVRVVNGRAERR